jgi:hypothetical protein
MVLASELEQIENSKTRAAFVGILKLIPAVTTVGAVEILDGLKVLQTILDWARTQLLLIMKAMTRLTIACLNIGDATKNQIRRS